MMRVAKFWSFGVCRLSTIMGLDGNQLLVLEKKYIWKNQQRVFFQKSWLRCGGRWRLNPVPSIELVATSSADYYWVAGPWFLERAIACWVFFFFFLFDFRVSCPFRNNLQLRFSATATHLVSVTMSLANASKNWDLTCPLVGTSAPEIWRFIL